MFLRTLKRIVILKLNIYLNFIFLYKIFKIKPHTNPEIIGPLILLNFKISKIIKDTPTQINSPINKKINLFFITLNHPLI